MDGLCERNIPLFLFNMSAGHYYIVFISVLIHSNKHAHLHKTNLASVTYLYYDVVYE